jgi:putative peptide zinc metalloprotease protein
MNNPEEFKDIISNIVVNKANNEFYAFINDKCFRINYSIFQIVNALKEGCSRTEAEQRIIEQFHIDTTELSVIFGKFDEFIEKVRTSEKKKLSSYVKVKFPLINSARTEKLANVFKFLFQPVIFWGLLFILVFINIGYFFYKGEHVSLSNLSYLEIGLMYFISLVALVFHEIGHASASKYFGLKAKEIGFGFYFIFPVYYSNVTQIWTLPIKSRVIVNLGGIYFQLLINTFFIITSVSCNFPVNYSTILQYIIITNIIVAIYSLFPFFRNDGYWIYSDLFNIPNLVNNADLLPRKAWDLYKYKSEVFLCELKKNAALFIYCILNWAFRIFVFYKLVYNLVIVLSRIVTVDYANELLTAIKTWFNLSILIIGVYLFSRYLVRLIRNNVSINEGL